MKKYFSCGRLIEAFVILPGINYNWMNVYSKYSEEPELSWELVFSWLFWYISIGNVKINLEKMKKY